MSEDTPETDERANRAQHPANPRSPALDGVRALAVLLVMAHHWSLPWPRFSVDLGLLGVRLFFVLSGFLITGIILAGRDSIARGASATADFARAFYARRALRIFPLYYLVLGALLALDAPGVRDEWGWHATYSTSLLVARENHWIGLPSHFWSLSVEEHFYLLWPWLVLFAPRRALPWVFTAITLAGPLWRSAGLFAGLGRMALLYTLPGCLDSLGVGALLALLHRSSPALAPRARLAMIVTGSVVLTVASALTAGRGATALSHGAAAFKGLSHALLMGALVSACVATASDSAPNALARALAWAPLRWVGRVSYALYILHPMAPFALRALGLEPAGRAPQVLAYTAVSLAAAALSWRFVEGPLQGQKRAFEYEPVSPARSEP